MKRRTFLSAIGAAGLGSILPPLAGGFRLPGGEEPENGDDDLILQEQFRRAGTDHLASLPTGESVVRVGKGFLGSPYRAGTLDGPGEEHLVVNLREFDCVTLCESALAIARAVKRNAASRAGFEQQLQLMRYRGGTIDGYQSRLHYFTEWISDNEAKGLVRNITRHLGGTRDTRRISFMSGHRSAYPRLADPAAFAAIRKAEHRINSTERYVLEKDEVRTRQESLRSGDIIGITTSIVGLDCSHTGIVLEEQGAIKLLHASLDGKRVMISAGSLPEYLDLHPKHTGILVARPVSV
jgi:hypothetical protein